MTFVTGYFGPPRIQIRLNEILPSLHQALVQQVLLDVTEITHCPLTYGVNLNMFLMFKVIIEQSAVTDSKNV